MLLGYCGLDEESLKEIAPDLWLSWVFETHSGVWKWFINFEFFCTSCAPKVYIDDNHFPHFRAIYAKVEHGVAAIRSLEAKSGHLQSIEDSQVGSEFTRCVTHW